MHRRLVLIGLFCLAPLARADVVTTLTGPLLVGDLNCTACHAVDPAAASRIMPHASPSLSAIGRRITPQYLRALLNNPQQARPGTTMPDMLHALPPVERLEAVDALVQYLVSLGGPIDPEPARASATLITQGESLYHTVGCVACHQPTRPPAKLPEAETAPTEIPRLTRPGIPLGDLPTKTTLDALAAFLVDPLKTHSAGRMPSLKLQPFEARAIAAYLLRDQADTSKLIPVPGLTYALFEGNVDTNKLDKLKPVSQGVVPGFDVKSIQPSQPEFAIRLTGQLDVAAAGKHTITFAIRNEVRLTLDGKKVDLKGGKKDRTMEATLDLTAGQHPFELVIKQTKDVPALEGTWLLPEAKTPEKITVKSLSHPGHAFVPKGGAEFTADAGKAQRGKELFATLNCAACHAISDKAGPKAPAAPALAQLNPTKPGGCLDANPAAGRPAYALADPQRTALQQAVAQLQKDTAPPDPALVADNTLKAMNCGACHARTGTPGPDPGRLPYFSSTIEVDLGDEGRLAPHLNEIGAKLTANGLRKMLFEGRYVRPYLATRMPQFGEPNLAHLPDALAAADASKVPPLAGDEPPFSAKQIDDGRRLVGTQGLGCVNCHGWGPYKSLGAPAINLLASTGRLTRPYFFAYLAEPAKYRPGTRMPAFWKDGENAFKEIHNGNMQKQVEAIWAYLQMGERGGMPAGMAGEQDLLIPINEPITFRTFIKDVGSHAIAVGFRQKTHVAFDAAHARMAAAWGGDFLRTKGAWDGRAGNFTDMPGNVIMLPPGQALAMLDSQTAPWPVVDPKLREAPEGWKFKGYRFADDRTPTFLYRFNDVGIEETPAAEYTDKGGDLTRKIHLTAPAAVQNLYFRAAVGQSITAEADGSFLVDGKLRVRVKTSPNAPPTKRTTADGKQELIIPIDWTPVLGSGPEKFNGHLEVQLQW
jgi:mono/diheme cytochrome c family protein